MAVDFDGITTAIAARYAPAAVTPPVGLTNVRRATGDWPNALGALPTVLVVPDQGAMDTGGGSRAGLHEWIVRFYLALYSTKGVGRQMNACRKWLPILTDQLKTGGGVQLGGKADNAEVATWRMGVLDFAGRSYSGVELRIRVTTSEGWNPS